MGNLDQLNDNADHLPDFGGNRQAELAWISISSTPAILRLRMDPIFLFWVADVSYSKLARRVTAPISSALKRTLTPKQRLHQPSANAFVNLTFYTVSLISGYAANANRKQIETGTGCFARAVLTQQGVNLIGCLQVFQKFRAFALSVGTARRAGRRSGGGRGQGPGQRRRSNLQGQSRQPK